MGINRKGEREEIEAVWKKERKMKMDRLRDGVQ